MRGNPGFGPQTNLEELMHIEAHMYDKDFLTKMNTPFKEKGKENYILSTQILELLIIQYLFKNDDGKISFTEKMILKRYYTKYGQVMGKENIDFLNSCMNLDNLLKIIQTFIESNKIEKALITFVFDQLRKKQLYKRKYKKVILELKKELSI